MSTLGDDPLSETQVDRIPNIDQDEPLASHPDWKVCDTRVVTYRIDNEMYPGVYAETRAKALAHCTLIHGKVFEANYVPGRAFFRVRKTTK